MKKVYEQPTLLLSIICPNDSLSLSYTDEEIQAGDSGLDW